MLSKLRFSSKITTMWSIFASLSGSGLSGAWAKAGNAAQASTPAAISARNATIIAPAIPDMPQPR